MLYEQDSPKETSQKNEESPCREEKVKGKVAGLEPINFITSASPHLGSRGHRQVTNECSSHSRSLSSCLSISASYILK